MPEFCDVALPVPLEAVFTYRLDGRTAVVGGRVLVPFRSTRLTGVVVEVHDRAPSVPAKDVLHVLDIEPVLDDCLLKLGRWIAHYYIAPLGEVLRGMLPLGAEVVHARAYRIRDAGREALHEAAQGGSSLHSRRSAGEQDVEYAVLNYLSEREEARELTLRAGTKASRALLDRLVARKWVSRHDVSAPQDAPPSIAVAVLAESTETENAGETSGRKGRQLNAQQAAALQALRVAGGRLVLDRLRTLGIPRSSILTLTRRGLISIMQETPGFHISSLRPAASLGSLNFNDAQRAALQQICAAVGRREFSAILLHGVTGSGKTAVYLAAMKTVLGEGRSAMMLVPEIGLTPAAAAHLYETFGEQVAILHSGLSEAERAQQWRRIRNREARVVVGTRSAVFAPVSDLALLVVDEEHDLSYKQEETPRYHARDVAIMRAKMADAAVVLGSATPAMESYYNACNGKYALISLPERVEKRPLPAVEVVDMREEFRDTGSDPLISRRLTEQIRERLARREQVMVLLNRRGYAPVVLCRACGKALQCQNCDISLTHHKGVRRMQCHYCGYNERVPQVCPECGSEYVYYIGAGSEKLEEHLHGLFPRARIARLDRDTVRGRRDFERVLNALNAGELDMVVGTQMIAKGHDIHGVTLVGVVGADLALKFPDFRAAERTFQLLTQVAGRAGRGSTPGTVVLQTYFPEHYAVRFAAQHNFSGFYEKELRFRNWMKYPPFAALANVLVRSESLDDTLKWTGTLGNWFAQTEPHGIKVLGPASAPIARLKRDYRYHFILKSQSREQLNATLRAMLAHAAERKVPRGNIVVDVDAQSLL